MLSEMLRNQQKFYLAQQEKTLILGLLVVSNFSFLTRGQFHFISQPSAKYWPINYLSQLLFLSKVILMVLVKLLKTNLLSELGKEKAFIRLRKSLCYWVQISIQCYPFGNSRFKKKTLLEIEKANKKQSQSYNEYTLFMKLREIKSTNYMLLLSFLFKCIYELNTVIFIRLSLSQLKLT